MSEDVQFREPERLLAVAAKAVRTALRAVTSTPDDFNYIKTEAHLKELLKPHNVLLLFHTADGVVTAPPIDVLATLEARGRVVRVPGTTLVTDPPFDARDAREGAREGALEDAPVPPCYVYFEAELEDRSYSDSRVLRYCVAHYHAMMKPLLREARIAARKDADADTDADTATRILSSPHALAVPLDGSLPQHCDKTQRRCVDAMYKTVHAVLHDMPHRPSSGRPRRTGAAHSVYERALAEYGICLQPPTASSTLPRVVDIHVQCFGMQPDGARIPWRISAVVAVEE